MKFPTDDDHDDERRTIRYAFTLALVTAAATKAIDFVFDEVRDALTRRRDARERRETCDACAAKAKAKGEEERGHAD